MGSRTSTVSQPNTPFSNEQLQKIKNEFCLQRQNVHELYESFARFDTDSKGYLDLDDFTNYFEGDEPNFVELPYLEHFFILVHKQRPNQIFFEEFVASVSSFCLMNNESILKFVFDWIDTDGDERISKRDIIRATQYRNPRTGQHTFYVNFIPEILRIRVKEGDENDGQSIEFDVFRQFTSRLSFLIWPAFRFQEALREQILGQQFWKQLYLRIQRSEYVLKTNEKKFSRMRQKIEQLKSLQIKQPEHRRIFKDTYKLPGHKIVSTDLNLQKHMPLQRRRSCLYIKPEFYADNEQQ